MTQKVSYLKCTIQWLLVPSELHDYYHNLIWGHLHTFQQSLLILPDTWPLATTNPLSVSVDLPVQDISYQWNNRLCHLLYLASLTEHHFSRIICMVVHVSASFIFLAESYISLYVCMCHFFCLFIHQ